MHFAAGDGVGRFGDFVHVLLGAVTTRNEAEDCVHSVLLMSII